MSKEARRADVALVAVTRVRQTAVESARADHAERLQDLAERENQRQTVQADLDEATVSYRSATADQELLDAHSLLGMQHWLASQQDRMTSAESRVAEGQQAAAGSLATLQASLAERSAVDRLRERRRQDQAADELRMAQKSLDDLGMVLKVGGERRRQKDNNGN